jgi:hypothetical protein
MNCDGGSSSDTEEDLIDYLEEVLRHDGMTWEDVKQMREQAEEPEEIYTQVNGDDWTCPACGGHDLKCEVTHNSHEGNWTCWVIAEEVDMTDDGSFSVPQFGEYLTGEEPASEDVWIEEANLCCAKCGKPVTGSDHAK